LLKGHPQGNQLPNQSKAEGTCNNQSPPPENIDKKADMLLNEVTFGPFQGTSLDKTLSHKDSYSKTDHQTKSDDNL
jgi:hypothetical protein